MFMSYVHVLLQNIEHKNIYDDSVYVFYCYNQNRVGGLIISNTDTFKYRTVTINYYLPNILLL